MPENSAVYSSLWSQCIRSLEAEFSEQQFNTWIRPLQPVEDGQILKLLAPNRFVVDWVQAHCLSQIRSWWRNQPRGGGEVVVEVGSRATARRDVALATLEPDVRSSTPPLGSRLNAAFTFESFVEGKSNQLARAAAMQVGKIPAAPTTRCSSMAASGSARPI